MTDASAQSNDPPMLWNGWGDPAAAKPLSPGIRSLLEQALESEVKLRVCQQSLALHGMTLDDVIDGVEILGATSIIDLSLNADHVMYF